MKASFPGSLSHGARGCWSCPMDPMTIISDYGMSRTETVFVISWAWTQCLDACFCRSDQWIVSCSSGGCLRLWEVSSAAGWSSSAEVLYNFRNSIQINALAISPVDKFISFENPGSMYVLNTETRDIVVMTLRGRGIASSTVLHLSFSNDSTRLLSAFDDCEIQLWGHRKGCTKRLLWNFFT